MITIISGASDLVHGGEGMYLVWGALNDFPCKMPKKAYAGPEIIYN